MKITTFLLVVMLAVAGSAYAADTSATAAAVGTYPVGTSYNGVALSGLVIGSGAMIWGDGSGADGKLTVQLLGLQTPLGQQIINVNATVNGGSRAAANVATLTGTASVDLGNGTPPVSGVPIVVTITTDANNKGTVGVVLGGTALPAATVGDGTVTVEDFAQ
jgi:hypothetical protein